MTQLPSEREVARAARQAALGKLETDIDSGIDIERLADRMEVLRRENSLAELIAESFARGRR